MPIRNHFPIFHKLKEGAYQYAWTDKCERLLPKHYKQRCLEYMTRDPVAVHWVPDTRKYRVDEYGTRYPVQNHPIHVLYPVQCNKGLWAGEGIVKCWMRYVHGTSRKAINVSRIAKLYAPHIQERILYSEILDKWLKIPCTNRAMDQIDDAFGLDYYILQTHERDLNSKLGMDLRRKMLVELCKMSEDGEQLSEERQKVFTRYKDFMIPLDEAIWVGLTIKEALDKAEHMMKPSPPLKDLIEAQYLEELRARPEVTELEISAATPITMDEQPKQNVVLTELKSWFGSKGEKKSESKSK